MIEVVHEILGIEYPDEMTFRRVQDFLDTTESISPEDLTEYTPEEVAYVLLESIQDAREVLARGTITLTSKDRERIQALPEEKDIQAFARWANTLPLWLDSIQPSLEEKLQRAISRRNSLKRI